MVPVTPKPATGAILASGLDLGDRTSLRADWRFEVAVRATRLSRLIGFDNQKLANCESSSIAAFAVLF